MLSINTNLSSIISQNSMKTSTDKLNQAIERMSSGFKINHAKDNAANYSISTNMTTKIGAYQVAEDNAAMGLDMLTSAEQNLAEIESKLVRLRSLQEQAMNGSYGKQSLDAINAEVNALVAEAERLYATSEYNGQKLFDVIPKMTTDFETPTVNSQGFIKHIDRIDTTGMKRLSEVENRNVSLTDGEYAICILDDLLALVELANNGKLSAGDTFIMGADIDVGKYCEENMATGGWTPIGDRATNSASLFKGTFDGNGYTISNVKIDRATSNYQGLFGYVYGTIRNLKVEDVDIVGQNVVGGLTANLLWSTIENCAVTGKIMGVEEVGGILGSMSQTATFNDSYTDVIVSGNSHIGGFAGFISASEISNCFSLGAVYGLSSNSRIGGLIGSSMNCKIANCYSSANVYAENSFEVGGLIGNLYYSQMTDCFSTGNVIGAYTVGGLVGNSYSNYSSTSGICSIKNCYTTSNVTGNSNSVGGIVGALFGEIENCTMKGCVKGSRNTGGIVGVTATDFSIKNCSFEGEGVFNTSNSGLLIGVCATNQSEINISGCQIVSKIENVNSSLIGSVTPNVACNINITDCTYNSYYEDNGIPLIKSQNANTTINLENIKTSNFKNNLNMQVGVNSGDSSSIKLSTSFELKNFEKLKNIGTDNEMDYLSMIDKYLSQISDLQTQFGAAQNRLESALDEISIQYENLVSSRSTLRDADIAQVSSHYIQQQILQQASATLMATANQSPSIALQLI